MKAHHVGIRVSNLAQSLEVYTKGLGCRLTHKIDMPEVRIAFITAGGTTLELIEKDGPVPHSEGMHVAFSVDDMERAVADLQSLGLDADLQKARPFQDGVILFFTGPDGEILELCQGVATAAPTAQADRSRP